MWLAKHQRPATGDERHFRVDGATLGSMGEDEWSHCGHPSGAKLMARVYWDAPQFELIFVRAEAAEDFDPYPNRQKSLAANRSTESLDDRLVDGASLSL